MTHHKCTLHTLHAIGIDRKIDSFTSHGSIFKLSLQCELSNVKCSVNDRSESGRNKFEGKRRFVCPSRLHTRHDICNEKEEFKAKKYIYWIYSLHELFSIPFALQQCPTEISEFCDIFSFIFSFNQLMVLRDSLFFYSIGEKRCMGWWTALRQTHTYWVTRTHVSVKSISLSATRRKEVMP